MKPKRVSSASVSARPGGLSPNDPSPGNRWDVPAICIFLAAIIWLVFGRTIQHDFVNFDDDVYVYKNPDVTNGLSWQAVARAFTQVRSSNWHPLTWMSHMLDGQWYGLKPGGHHLTNVLLHTATAILLFLVLWQMTRPREPTATAAVRGSVAKMRPSPGHAAALWGSAFIAAVFAVHPLRVESVAWVAERKDVLSGLFFMLTLGAYVRYVRRPWSVGRYSLVMLMQALALMSKPMVVTLPFVLLLLDYWPLKRLDFSGGKASPWRLIAEKLPLLALSGAACAVTLFSQKHAMSSLPFSLRLENAVVSCVVYLKQMIYPAGLAVLYPFPVGGIASWKIAASAVLLLAISAVAVAGWRKRPWWLVGWLWYLGMLVPVIGLLQVGVQARADRYTYLPQIGLTVLLTWSVADWCAGWRQRRWILGGLGAVILAALILSARTQTAFWRNSESLWTHTLACTSDNFMAHDNYGNALLDQGKTDEAIAHFEQAIQIKPDHAEAHYNLANALVRKGRSDDAIVHYQRALELKPDDPKTHCNLGIAYLQKGDVDDAIAQLQITLQLKPDDLVVRNNLGNALFQKGKLDEAIAQFQQILQLKPDDPKAWCNLGIAFLQKGNTDEGIANLRKALQLEPDNAVIWNNLGNALVQKGDLDEAISQFQQFLQTRPNDAATHFNLGDALLKKGNVDDAIVHFQKCLSVLPNSAEAEFSLASALVQSRREAEAIAHFQRALQINPDYPEACNDLAWELATSPQASLRDGNKAVELAERANQVAEGKDVDVLDTLAAAKAEAGRFEDAIRITQKAIELAQSGGQTNQAAELGDRLKLYQEGQPYHRQVK